MVVAEDAAVSEHERLSDKGKLDFVECSKVLFNPKMMTTLLDCPTHYCHIRETINESYRLT